MSSYFSELEQRIATAMQADRFRLRNLLRAVKRAEDEGRPPDDQLAKLLSQLEESLARRDKRQALVPRLEYDEALPVVARREEIAAAIRDHQVVVICGETGSGKSTQLPKICLELGRGIAGMIGHTQPRRIAARSIASRLGEELRTSVGQKVGFKIRFTDVTGPSTLVKVMTDGVLLAESQHDRFLEQYDTLIIDEAHERSLNIDFLLGYLHRLLPKRPDLRLIITSATIDAARFAAHFSRIPEAAAAEMHRPPSRPVPIIEVSGRTYPVDILYRPLVNEEGDWLDPERGVTEAVAELCQHGFGDILVFLPTERDILSAAHKLRGRNFSGGQPEIVPLYARLSTAEQNRVFQPHSGRRIVLATNVAESSLTVPGIRYVVDTGTARISRYSARTKLQRLPIEAVSQASANQRAGRCGRVGPGVCVRLYSEDDFLARDPFTSPEIQRTNLAAVILQLLTLDLGPIDEFPFLDPPRAESIRDGYKTLYELGAVDDNRLLTPVGRQLARLPVDPRIGRMILEAHREHCLADVLIIASALENQDPRERPADKQGEADQAHAQWAHPDSDFLAWLNLWDFVQELKAKTTRSQFRKAARQNFLSELRLREWQDVHRQLLDMVSQSGLTIGKRRHAGQPSRLSQQRSHNEPPITENPAYAAIHRSLLAGLLSSIANRGDTNEYTAAGGGKFFLWPGSGTSVAKPKWIVAGEMLETARRYLRTIARIDPDWIEPLATHLVTRSYSDPHWDRRAGGAMASEKVTLLGLTIVPRRRVRYTTIEPRVARHLFLQHALVEGDIETKAPFFRQNRQLVEAIEAKAAKSRRREFLIEPQAIYDYYDARLPATVVDAPTLDKWLRANHDANKRALLMTESDLLGQPADLAPHEYPDTLELDRMKLPLRYHFEPGAPEDGVTVTVPREGLAQLSPERLGWLVPGLVASKIEALLRTLPKNTRRNFGPPADVARQLAGKLPFASGPFLRTVASELTALAGEPIAPEMFDLERLPLHLQMKIRVVDHGGKTVVEGRDLDSLREHLGVDRGLPPPTPGSTPWHRDGLTKWDFGALPEKVDLRRGGLTLLQFPALVDQGDSAALRLLETAIEATRQTRLGALRLFVLSEHRELKTQVRWLPGLEKIRLQSAPLRRVHEAAAAEMHQAAAQGRVGPAAPGSAGPSPKTPPAKGRAGQVAPGGSDPPKKSASSPIERTIEDQLIDLIASRAFYAVDQIPRDAESYEAQRLAGRKNLLPAVQEVTRLVQSLFEIYHELSLALEAKHPTTWQYALDDLRDQQAALLAGNFLTTTPWPWLQHFPRYLKAMALRLKKITSSGLPRDRQAHDQVARHWQAYRQRIAEHRKRLIDDPELDTYRWMIEELRVSLFAQELGTSMPVSPQRLDKQWAKVHP